MPQRIPSRTHGASEGAGKLYSALRVHHELLLHDLIVHARPDVVLQDVGQGDEQIVHTLVLDQFLKKLLRFAAVVPPQELPHRIERDLPLEVHVKIVQEVPYELFHGCPPHQARYRYRPRCPYSRPEGTYATKNMRILRKFGFPTH